MPRVLAYPIVVCMAFGVIIGLLVLVWSVAFGGRAGDVKTIAAPLVFITWWSWTGISVYRDHIQKPAQEMKRQRAEAAAYIEKTITPGSNLAAAIQTLRERFTLIGEPRHRRSPDQSGDITVEIETQGFIISLLSRDGVVNSWSVR
jgi:hypothetical protein